MDANNTNPLYNDPLQQVHNTLEFNNGVVQIADPLAVEIDDLELVRITDKRIKEAGEFYKYKYNLAERRKKNKTYRFGRQIAEIEKKGKLKEYETRSSDNAIYEIETSLKPLAMSKLPDIIVTPGGDDPDRKESAKNLSVVVDDMNKKRRQREVLGLGFKHLPVYFTAVIKARWDSEKGTDGDYRFDNIHPEYVIVDHTATSKNPDDMTFIAQCVPTTIQEVIMRFPKKKDDFIDAVKVRGIMVDPDKEWQDMASEIKIWEVWFDYYKKKGSDELVTQEEQEYMSLLEPGIKWEKISGVLWKYDNVILDKMLDPNFDHEGEDKLYTYDIPGDETTKHEVDSQQLLMSAMLGQPIPNLVKEKIYHNYFKKPRKPFYFFGYEQWGETYLDETSRIEQNIRNQENLDDQNKTILDQLKTRVKHIWGGDSGLRKADIQRLDMDDPKMDVRVEGDPNKVHKSIEPERPDAAQFSAISSTRDRMYAIAHATAVRGQLQSDVATTNQIGREGDFAVSDDLVEDTVNAACEWMAEWQMQFIKLRYTNEHLKEILGSKGNTTYIRLRRDTISDGMEVMIKASSTDKLKAQRNAMETAKLGPPFTNPLDFFTDMGMSDPEGRTEKGVLFATDPAAYFTKFVLKLEGTQAQAAALNGGMPGQPVQPGMPQPPMSQPAQQSQPSAPQNPSPMNTSAVPAPPPAIPQASPRNL